MRKLLLWSLSLIVIISVLMFGVLSVSAEQTSGTVGECTWQLDGTKLTISGNGSMGFGSTAYTDLNITELIVEEGVTDIYMFIDWEGLQTVTLPSTLKKIDKFAFYRCSSLLSIEIPESVIEIGNSAFYGCSLLHEVKISKNVVSFGSSVFSECSNLDYINVDEDNPILKSVDGVLFNKDMTTVIRYPPAKAGVSYVVPSSVKIIDNYAFSDAWRLESIDLPDDLVSIGFNAFTFSRIEYLSGNQFNGAFYIENYLITYFGTDDATFSVREGTTLIAAGAFAYLHNIVTLYIPDGVEYIGSNCFIWSPKLAEVYLPRSIKRIEDSAFLQCGSLKRIYYRGNKSDKAKISIDVYNTSLHNAIWVYNSCVDSSQHSWDDIITTPATCISEGSHKKTCGRCQYVFTETIPMVEHKYTITSLYEAPSCTKKGIDEKKCEVCNHTKTVLTEAIGHNFGEWIEESSTLCTELRTLKRICSMCDTTEERMIDAVEHIFGDWFIDKQPSCDEKGIEKSECLNCDEYQTREVEALSHEYGEFTVVKEPAVNEQGLKQKKCKNCGDIIEQHIPSVKSSDDVINDSLNKKFDFMPIVIALVAGSAVIVFALIIINKKRKTK